MMKKTLSLLLCMIFLLGNLGLPMVANAESCPNGGRHSPLTKTTPATCTGGGLVTTACTKCGKVISNWILTPLGHDWGEWQLWPEPTCYTDGTVTRVCKRDSSHKETQVYPAYGGPHDFKTLDTSPATCLSYGAVLLGCTKCGEEDMLYIKPLGHDWECTVIRQSTCVKKGEKSCVCKRNASHVTISELPLAEHKPKWVQTKPPTSSAEGERQSICQVCNKVLKKEAIPKLTRQEFSNNSMCSLGLRFRDVAPKSTEKWFMFTPIDLSQDGEQHFPLIATNSFVIGDMTVAVKEGNITVTYELIKGATVSSEYLTFFPDFDTALSQKPDELGGTNFAFGKPINIEKDLAGDTNVLLLLVNEVSFHSELKGLKPYSAKDPDYAKALAEMKEILARE